MDSTLNRWWYAAAVDRDLMRREEPQIYGTQNIVLASGKPKRYKLDSTQVTDKERKYHYVPMLAEQQENARVADLKNIFSLYVENQSVEKMLDLIKSEFRKDKSSNYNINEDDINGFGYSLITENKLQEALAILKLNTKLYPDVSNTYDSYGEILLKLNETEKGLTAYRKSLELNPENENAKKILQEFKD